MAKAEPGHIYATADVLDRSNTVFATAELAPFAVKGKAQPVRAWSVGRAVGSRARQVSVQQLALVGRDPELEMLRKALDDARGGAAQLIEIVGEAGIGKTRLLDALREQAAGFRVLHAVCEAYTASTPYAVWRELLRELMDFGRDDPDEAVAQRLRDVVGKDVPHLHPWLPLIAIAFGLEFAPTAEVEMLAEKNRRPKLHEAVGEFLALIFPGPGLIAIENAHHIDMASAELLSYLAGGVGGRPWVFGVARRPSAAAFTAPAAVRIELAPLDASDALRMAQRGAEQHPLPMHVLEVVAKRSGGNPQFLRDLLRAAIQSGGIGGLPESAEAATMARIDALAPEDRALVRRASVFGLTFHPRMLSWLDEEGDGAHADAGAWTRLRNCSRRNPTAICALAARCCATRLTRGCRTSFAGAFTARWRRGSKRRRIRRRTLPASCRCTTSKRVEYRPAWCYGSVAARRAHEVYAYLEAAELYSRALGRRTPAPGYLERGPGYGAGSAGGFVEPGGRV